MVKKAGVGGRAETHTQVHQQIPFELFQGYSYGARSSQAVHISSYPPPESTQSHDADFVDYFSDDRDISRSLIHETPTLPQETPEHNLRTNPRAPSPLTYSADHCARKKNKSTENYNRERRMIMLLYVMYIFCCEFFK